MSTPSPADFTPHFRKSPVTDPWEPILSRRCHSTVELALVIAAAHCNSRGLLHGGVIATLADNAMGLSLGVTGDSQYGANSGIVTTSLAVDYMASARAGQFLVISPRVLKAARASGVVDAIITADGEIIARANASFRVLAVT